jgi:uncharacterized protein
LPWIVGVVALLLLLAYVVPSWMAVRLLTDADRRALTFTPSDRGLVYENVSFPSRADEITLRGWWIEGEGASGPQTVIMIHGRNSIRDDPGLRYLDLAAALARAGYDVLMFDLRGHGESDDATFTLGYREPRDVLGAIDYAASRGVPPEQIALLGFSTGAVSALRAAVEEPGVGAVIADGAWPSQRELLDREIPKNSPLPGFYHPGIYLVGRALYGFDVNVSRPVDDVRALSAANRPLLLIHGADDEYTDEDGAHRLRDAAAGNPNAQYWEVEDAPHVRIYALHPDEYLARLLPFLAESIGEPGVGAEG